ncbi:MAG: hypothetical protein KAR20_30005 [Candidatus Heimdallarchaeota archaeon]|nr:hypothetical protein [Candidatus Heimdallarchaeota archaeon]
METISEDERKEIPKDTLYCYKILSIDSHPDDERNLIIKTKNCPFYKHIDELDGWCIVLKDEIDDCCKICGISEGHILDNDGDMSPIESE